MYILDTQHYANTPNTNVFIKKTLPVTVRTNRKRTKNRQLPHTISLSSLQWKNTFNMHLFK